jgi:hypothetical protein
MRFRPSLRRAFTRVRAETGFVDLASILVGVIVVGLLSGAIAAAVFAVVPWAQDKAAAATLSTVTTAQQVARARTADNGDGRYLPLDDLVHDGYLPAKAAGVVAVATDDSGRCWVGLATSGSGKRFVTEDGEPAREYGSATISNTTCPVDVVGLAEPKLRIRWASTPVQPAFTPAGGSFTGGATLLLSGTDYLYSPDNGATIRRAAGPWLATPAPTGAASRDGSTAVVLGKRTGNISTVFFTADGSTWLQRNVPFGGLDRILGISGNTIVAQQSTSVAAPNSGLAVSTDTGLTWSTFDSPVAGATIAQAAASTDGDTVIVIATNGDSYTSRNSGISWQRSSIGAPVAKTGATSSADARHLIVTDTAGHGYISHDTGQTWTSLPAAAGTPFLSDTGSTVVISSPSAGVLVSVDGGASFTPRNPDSAHPTVVGLSADGRTVIGYTGSNTLWTARIG